LPESEEDEEDETDEIQAGKAELVRPFSIFHLGVKLSGVTCFGDVWGCLGMFDGVSGCCWIVVDVDWIMDAYGCLWSPVRSSFFFLLATLQH
jgi:hypothetical protein